MNPLRRGTPALRAIQPVNAPLLCCETSPFIMLSGMARFYDDDTTYNHCIAACFPYVLDAAWFHPVNHRRIPYRSSVNFRGEAIYFCPKIYVWTRNTLDCDKSNHSSRIVFSYTPTEFASTGNSAIRSADPENPTPEPNVKWIGWPIAEMAFWFFFQMRGRSSVGRQYVLTLMSYTPLRYVRNV